MPNWVFGVFVIVGLLAVALLRENLRMNELKAVAAQRSLALHSPFVPGERPPMRLLAERTGAQPNNANIWPHGGQLIREGDCPATSLKPTSSSC